MQFHENFKRIANDKGTTPTAVLRALGLTCSKVARWNKGSLPNQETLVRLAKYLDCSVMDFFWSEDDDHPVAAPADPSKTPTDEDEKDILRVYRMLSRKDRHEFMSIVYDFEKRQEPSGDTASTSKTAE